MAGANDFELMMTNYLKTAENIITYFDDDKEKRNEMLQKLEVSVRNNCFHSARAKKVAETVREVTSNIDQSSKSEDIMKLFNEKKTALHEYQPDVSNNSNIMEFCRQVKELKDHADGVRSDLGDDDIEMTENEINVIDPFTKKRMVNPVKNKVCGHVYDRDSVNEIVKLNKKTRCPVVGCSNKAEIDLNNMVVDIVTRKYLHDNPA